MTVRTPLSPCLTSPWGAPIYRLDCTSSTMDEASCLIAASPLHGTIVIAERQSAGRGRSPGSRWWSESGANLLMTLMLRQAETEAAPATVPLRVGCALAETAESMGVSPSIKWPNDLLVGGRKLAGVLCTATRGWLLVGVGMNCNQWSFPPDSRDPTSLALCLGREVDRARLEADVLASIRRLLDADDWLVRLRRRLAGVGGRAKVEQDSRTIEGVLLGVDGSGALRLREGSGVGQVTRVLSGSLTLGTKAPRQSFTES